MNYATLNDLLQCLTYGTHLHVGVLFFGKYGNASLSLPHEQTIHAAPVCEALKTREGGYRRCFYCRNAAIAHACDAKHPFGGLCINGVYEYTHPVLDGDEMICIVYIGNILADGKGAQKLSRRLGERRALLETMEHGYTEDQCRMLAHTVESYIRMLLLHPPAEKKAPFNPIIENIKTYVLSNVRSGISVSELTRVFHYNEKYLGRLFKRETGTSLHEFINNERLSLAERLLRETDESILSISERVGFNNVTYFNRLFKERHCVSPIEFRKRERAR
jgi:AraC-like DNA-binding protein